MALIASSADDDRSLSKKTLDAREATKVLDYSSRANEGNAEILVAISHLEGLITEQSQQNRELMTKLRGIARRTETSLNRAEALAKVTEEKKDILQDAAMSGWMEAHSMAEEEALEEIKSVAEAAKKEIETLEKAANARTERLLKLTFPDKLFQFLKWFLVILGVVIGTWFVFHAILGL